MRPWPARTVRMRTADSEDADFHLLEELAKPPACTSGGRICVWVYWQGPVLREIILSGHAESRTCSKATAILVEAAQRLDESVEWMLTCGAAFFRIVPPPPGVLAAAPPAQRLLGEAVEALHTLAEETGLVEIYRGDWRRLAAFRSRFQAQRGSGESLLVLPSEKGSPPLADYLPVVPGPDPDGPPLIFRLEGWDFDCPGFQAVADLHLQNLRRELLRNALERRQTYRTWLQDWMQVWVPELRWLPANAPITLQVPPQVDAPPDEARPLDAGVASFLREHAASFLDRGQRWHRELATRYAHLSFGLASDAKLDEKIWPATVTEIDFERGEKTTRPSTPDDAPFTLRERLTQSDPQLISHCLLYIRRMDEIIQPYERLRGGGAGSRAEPDAKQRGVQVVSEISRRIVVETMIRGWPSFYLEDERDREAFERWARAYRPHVWSVLARQARRAGVALEILLEDNVVYDIRFDDDLGCTVQPLLLVDETTHAQVHGTRAGASVAVPLWSRRTVSTMDAGVLALGPTNERRATELVSRARQLAGGDAPDLYEAASCLRAALACHPGEAGRQILEEWVRRIGRETRQELDNAQRIIEAFELCARRRLGEAKPLLAACLGSEEEEPVSDAWVLAALGELIGSWSPRDEEKKLRKAAKRHDKLVDKHNQLVAVLQQQETTSSLLASIALFADTAAAERLRKIAELTELRREIEQAAETAQAASAKLEQEHERCRGLIESALADPDSVAGQHPLLAGAARRAPEQLAEIRERPLFLIPQPSREFVRRYGRVRGLIEAHGLLDIFFTLSRIAGRIGQEDERVRRECLREMKSVQSRIWLPDLVAKDLESLSQELAKGKWDRLQAAQIDWTLGSAIGTCLGRLSELMHDRLVLRAPFVEALVLRIHVLHILDAKYQMALTLILEARVVLACVVSRPWKVLDRELALRPPGSRFGFDPASGEAFLDAPDGRRPLLRVEGLSRCETDHLRSVFRDPELPARLDRYAPSIADALLGAEVEPGPDWQSWRDAMAKVSRELLTVMSRFRYRANLMPDASPSLTEQGEVRNARMNHITPHTDPVIDWEWQDLGVWRDLLGAKLERRRDSLPRA